MLCWYVWQGRIICHLTGFLQAFLTGSDLLRAFAAVHKKQHGHAAEVMPQDARGQAIG
jgi:hypothetical protein